MPEGHRPAPGWLHRWCTRAHGRSAGRFVIVHFEGKCGIGDDPVVGASIVQAGQARLVDLDPEQQLVSQIWGLRLSLTRTAGARATARRRVAWFSAALLAAYGIDAPFGRTPACELILTMQAGRLY